MRGIRILARAGALEGVAARLNLALELARLAADAVAVPEPVVIGLQVAVGDAPVPARAVRGECLLAVARLGAAAHLEIPRQKAPRRPAPVHGRPAHALPGLEPAQLAHPPRRPVPPASKPSPFP